MQRRTTRSAKAPPICCRSAPMWQEGKPRRWRSIVRSSDDGARAERHFEGAAKTGLRTAGREASPVRLSTSRHAERRPTRCSRITLRGFSGSLHGLSSSPPTWTVEMDDTEQLLRASSMRRLRHCSARHPMSTPACIARTVSGPSQCVRPGRRSRARAGRDRAM